MKRLIIAMVLFMLTGCAIQKAMNQRTVDFSVVKVGAQQYEIESQLGHPIDTKVEGNITTSVYYVESGDPHMGRAALHAIGDYATLFLWEIVAKKIEDNRIKKFKLLVTYVDGTCTNIKSLPIEDQKPKPVAKEGE